MYEGSSGRVWAAAVHGGHAPRAAGCGVAGGDRSRDSLVTYSELDGFELECAVCIESHASV
jgi:hypothetical protein